jgi:alkylated DNA repair dioxygenase AlkB
MVDVPGLAYLAGFVAESDEPRLIAAVDAEPWLTDLKRRVQHYGYRYDYKARKVDPAMYLGPLPAWSQPLAERLVADGHMAAPDQLIVNEYEPGQGITPHVDCVPCFGPVVCSITLGSQCVMELTSLEKLPATSLLLERRSLVVLAGPSRYKWRHAIPGRKSDKVADQELPRGRRVSLTFRTVLVGEQGRG